MAAGLPKQPLSLKRAARWRTRRPDPPANRTGQAAGTRLVTSLRSRGDFLLGGVAHRLANLRAVLLHHRTPDFLRGLALARHELLSGRRLQEGGQVADFLRA